MHRLNPHDPEQKDQNPPPQPSPAYVENFLILAICLSTLGLLGWGAWKASAYFNEADFSFFNGGGEVEVSDLEKSVVNIVCPEAGETFDFSQEHVGGTGYVLDKSGKILTNFHIIASEEDEKKPMNLNEKGCLVLFPDEGTGYSNETYLAKPIYYKFLSPEYDLAYMQIYDVFKEEEKAYAPYPRSFTPLPLRTCSINELELGDEVYAMGYPGATEGYYLTLAKGIVSAFSSYTKSVS